MKFRDQCRDTRVGVARPQTVPLSRVTRWVKTQYLTSSNGSIPRHRAYTSPMPMILDRTCTQRHFHAPVRMQRQSEAPTTNFTEKRTSGMSRPTPIAAVPPPGQLTSRGQSVGVADRHATTAGAARATRRGREGRRGGDLYGGGCPCSSTPCAGTRGRDKARGAQKVEHMF